MVLTLAKAGNDAGFGTWYGNGDTWGGAFGSKSLFAVSGVISAVPEPASMGLLGLGWYGTSASPPSPQLREQIPNLQIENNHQRPRSDPGSLCFRAAD